METQLCPGSIHQAVSHLTFAGPGSEALLMENKVLPGETVKPGAPGRHDKTGLCGLASDNSHSCHPGSWAWQSCSRCFLERSQTVLNITGPLRKLIGSDFWDDFAHGERQDRIWSHAIYYLSPLLGSSLIPTSLMPSPPFPLPYVFVQSILESKLCGTSKIGVGNAQIWPAKSFGLGLPRH